MPPASKRSVAPSGYSLRRSPCSRPRRASAQAARPTSWRTSSPGVVSSHVRSRRVPSRAPRPLNIAPARADRHGVSIARPDRAFFFVAAACALAYVSLPRDTAYYDRWFQLFPVAAVVATLIGVTIHKPRSKAPWYLVALSGLCAVTADALYAIELETVGRVPFPSTSDYFALGSYVVLAAALLVMIRKQVPGRDWPSLI